MHQQLLSNNFNIFIALSIDNRFPFPQITTIIKLIQNYDEHSYFKVYLQIFLSWGCKPVTAIGILRP